MTESEWRDHQLNQHYLEEEMAEEVSNCCGHTIIFGDVCGNCKEHCDVTPRGEWLYEEKVNAECDRADSQRELEREDDNH